MTASKNFNRACMVCKKNFAVPQASMVRKTCSPACLSDHRRNLKLGKKQSPETVAKRKESMVAAWADTDRRDSWRKAAKVGLTRWLADPENAKAFAARSSERMKARHADPEWQKVRDARSSATLKATWEEQRENLTALSRERYQRWLETGEGICSPSAKQRKAVASQWIMKRAQEELHAKTNYDFVYAEVQAKMRRDLPYDGPQDGSEYMDYLRKLGVAVTCSPECRGIADSFMSDAIPRFAAQWKARKATKGKIA